MEITVHNLGKRYNREWVFRKMDLRFAEGSKTAITGYNGSGKSTLLRILSGYTLPSEGTVTFGGKNAAHSDMQTFFSFCAPYQQLIEEFTLTEHLNFHGQFREPLIALSDMIKQSDLEKAKNKQVREFSSGMKQRLRLALAFYFTSKIVFLDEPTSNLDTSGSAWYQELIRQHTGARSLVIASNQPDEYAFCESILSIENWK